MASLTIAQRFRDSITSTVGLFLLIFCLIAIIYDVISLEKELDEVVYNATALARVTLPTPIWNMDDKVLEDITEVIFLDQHILSLTVTADDETLTSRSRKGVIEEVEGALASILYLKKAIPILYNEREIASLNLLFSRYRLLEQLMIDCLTILLSGLALGFAISRRSLSLTRRFIFQPISELEQSATVLASGDLKHEIPIHSEDEIGSLAKSFNQMREAIGSLIDQLKQANRELEIYNTQLELKVAERTEALNEKNEQLNLTLDQVKEANEEILESIQYAQRIQQSLLPHLESVRHYLPHSFILFKPRDIVGGDFFITHHFPHGYFIAVFDCTGHGVPGALMTMIAITTLRNLLFEEKLYHDPAELLKQLNGAIKTTLRQDSDHSSSDDGLDGGVCFLDHDKGILTFAGAKTPLFYCPSRGAIKMVKGDRHSLGYRRSDSSYHFTNHTIPVEDDYSFYLTSDGYIDQLGGGKRFSFGTSRFKKLLAEISDLSYPLQQEALEAAFSDYRGDCEVQDDVTVIGFNAKQG
ncbi:MAG: SpoIIE family protein phosphatase [Gammaproteobacteria bacterium]|nr:SpoIIE family protein phosphatase [Gammaproteobacteria bacterium]